VHAYHEEVALLFPQMQMMPGAEQLLRSLKRQNIPIAIATSSVSHTVPLKTMHHPVFSECIDIVVTGDDPLIVDGKPSPDIFLLAAKRLGCEDPSSCVVFEDAPSGVLGGVRAGMHVIAVPDFRYLSQSVFDSHEDVFSHKSVSVLPSLEHVHVSDFFSHI
jgi:HAD superfamily hydrolase (TIGR01509 family)